MEVIDAEIVIVGAGIAGLATALALHRLGIKSQVLEASDTLRAAGVAFTTWTNAWKALDALGIAHTLRQQHQQLLGLAVWSTVSGDVHSYVPFATKTKHGEDHEARCVMRKVLLEALAKELPSGSIRYSSKLVSIQEEGFSRVLHLADGSILKTKLLIGCDGVNSEVARWLGFKKPPLTGRSAIRGCARFKANHGLPLKFQLFMGNGVKYGIIPCNDTAVYWFFTWSPSTQENREVLENADQAKLKQFVLCKLGNVPDQIKSVIEGTEEEEIICSPLRCRPPWEILWGNISKENVCVTGDAFHPMTPDLGQGGCSALEDGVILAKCLQDALLQSSDSQMSDKDKHQRIKNGLHKYANIRKWRGVDLIITGYVLGFIQESTWSWMRFLRERLLASYLSGVFLSRANIDTRELVI